MSATASTAYADLEEVATVNPSTFMGTQYNGRMDADVTKKDRLSFIIYWAPNTTTSYNGPARPSNFEYASDINNAFTALWNHAFSPTLLNEARASAVGYRYNLIAQNPQGTFGLPTDTFTGVGTQRRARRSLARASQAFSTNGPTPTRTSSPRT